MAICRQCGVPGAKGAQFCRSCGASLDAPPTVATPAGIPPAAAVAGDADGAADGGIRVTAPVIIGVVAVIVALLGAVAVLVATTGDDTPAAADRGTTSVPAAPQPGAATTGPAPTVTSDPAASSGGPPQVLTPVRTTASSSSPPAEDCGGTVAVTYDPENVLDGAPTTAWQVAGDGTGHTITFDLGASTLVEQVGLTPGYDKVQPCEDRVDRFFQNFRVSRVRWSFDDGSTVDQALDISDRSLQVTDVDATTRQVRMEIVSTVPGNSSDGDTAISEIQVLGVP